MKLLYYTHTYFLDCDLPLVEQLIHKGVDVKLVIDLPYYQLKSTMVDIARQIPRTDLMNASVYSELAFISHYISLDNVFVLNRTCKIYHIANYMMRYKFSKLIKKYNPDIIQCTDFVDLSDCFLYKYRKRLLQIVHDPFPHSGEKTFKKRLLRSLEYKLVKNFLLLNTRQIEPFVSENKLDSSYIHQASLGVYTCLQEFKNDKDITGIDNYVLFFGRISPYKGVEYLIKAMEKLHKDNQQVNLVIAGGGELYFEDLLKDKPYIKVINKFLTMDELYSLIKKCKIVACPYVDATQSGVIMSAYALAKVVVGTNVGGLPQMLGYGEYGPVVPARDSNALANVIQNILSNSKELCKYEFKIKEASLSGSFSWHSIADRYIDIYKKIKK